MNTDKKIMHKLLISIIAFIILSLSITLTGCDEYTSDGAESTSQDVTSSPDESTSVDKGTSEGETTLSPETSDVTTEKNEVTTPSSETSSSAPTTEALTTAKPADTTTDSPVTSTPEEITSAETTASPEVTEKPESTTAPVTTTKPIETTKPVVTTKPVETTKPVVTTKPVETTKPVVTTKPAETTKPVVTTKPVETTKPAETTKPDVPTTSPSYNSLVVDKSISHNVAVKTDVEYSAFGGTEISAGIHKVEVSRNAKGKKTFEKHCIENYPLYLTYAYDKKGNISFIKAEQLQPSGDTLYSYVVLEYDTMRYFIGDIYSSTDKFQKGTKTGTMELDPSFNYLCFLKLNGYTIQFNFNAEWRVHAESIPNYSVNYEYDNAGELILFRTNVTARNQNNKSTLLISEYSGKHGKLIKKTFREAPDNTNYPITKGYEYTAEYTDKGILIKDCMKEYDADKNFDFPLISQTNTEYYDDGVNKKSAEIYKYLAEDMIYHGIISYNKNGAPINAEEESSQHYKLCVLRGHPCRCFGDPKKLSLQSKINTRYTYDENDKLREKLETGNGKNVTQTLYDSKERILSKTVTTQKNNELLLLESDIYTYDNGFSLKEETFSYNADSTLNIHHTKIEKYVDESKNVLLFSSFETQQYKNNTLFTSNKECKEYDESGNMIDFYEINHQESGRITEIHYHPQKTSKPVKVIYYVPLASGGTYIYLTEDYEYVLEGYQLINTYYCRKNFLDDSSQESMYESKYNPETDEHITITTTYYRGGAVSTTSTIKKATNLVETEDFTYNNSGRINRHIKTVQKTEKDGSNTIITEEQTVFTYDQNNQPVRYTITVTKKINNILREKTESVYDSEDNIQSTTTAYYDENGNPLPTT